MILTRFGGVKEGNVIHSPEQGASLRERAYTKECKEEAVQLV